MSDLINLLKTNETLISSGEGNCETIEVYTGKRTLRAVKLRLAKERRGGRWAHAKVFSHFNNKYGKVFVDLETGAYC